MPARHAPGLPLRTALPLGVAALIGVTTAALAASAWLGLSRTLVDAWRELASSETERAILQARRVLDPAAPLTRLGEAELDLGDVDPEDGEAMLGLLVGGVEAFETPSWFTYSTPAGTYLAAYRWTHDGPATLRRTWRVRELDAEGRERTHERTWERAGDGTWALMSDVWTDYDPRERPFWAAVADAPEDAPRWLDPYVFLSSHLPGVTYARASRDASGALRGVWAVDFETVHLSSFVGDVRVHPDATAYLVTRSGEVLAHPDGQVVTGDGDDTRLLKASLHPDARLRAVWGALAPDAGDAGDAVAVDGLLAVRRAFPEASGIPWEVLLVVPTASLLAGAQAQLRQALLLGGAVLLAALVLGLVVARRLTAVLASVEAELDRTARFELEAQATASGGSWVRELNSVGEALASMRRGLRSFGRYVPKPLVRRVMEAGVEARLGVEPRDATVLFCDIAGFTTMVESTPVAVVLDALGRWLDVGNAAIEASGGVISTFGGDAIMALWGVPAELSDHAVRACEGALAFRDAVSRLNEEAARSGGPVLETRFGIDGGVGLAGNIGAEDRFTYTVIGDAVNTASRLEGLNKVYGTTILVSERVVAKLGDAMVVQPVDRVRVQGKHEPVLVYELLGRRGEVADDALRAVAEAGRAFELLRERRFAEAAEAFDAAARARGDDGGAARVLADRARGWAVDVPPEDWDGVYVATGK